MQNILCLVSCYIVQRRWKLGHIHITLSSNVPGERRPSHINQPSGSVKPCEMVRATKTIGTVAAKACFVGYCQNRKREGDKFPMGCSHARYIARRHRTNVRKRAYWHHKRRVFLALVPPILIGVLSVTRVTYGRTSSPSLVISALITASRPRPNPLNSTSKRAPPALAPTPPSPIFSADSCASCCTRANARTAHW